MADVLEAPPAAAVGSPGWMPRPEAAMCFLMVNAPKSQTKESADTTRHVRAIVPRRPKSEKGRAGVCTEDRTTVSDEQAR